MYGEIRIMNVYFSFFIICISVLLAVTIVRKESVHCNHLNECISMVKETGERAFNQKESFNEILRSLYVSDKYSSIDIPVKYIKNSEDGMKLPEAWEKAVMTSDIKLNQWEKDVLKHYGNNLFLCQSDKIKEYTDIAVSQLSVFKENATEKKLKTIKTNAVCTVSAGLMIALLIL